MSEHNGISSRLFITGLIVAILTSSAISLGISQMMMKQGPQGIEGPQGETGSQGIQGPIGDWSFEGKSWQKIKTFTGTGDAETEFFEITSNIFKIEWEAMYLEGARLYSSLIFFLCNEHDQIILSVSAANTYMLGTDYVIGEEPGYYYIQIIPSNLEEWTIIVEILQ